MNDIWTPITIILYESFHDFCNNCMGNTCDQKCNDPDPINNCPRINPKIKENKNDKLNSST
jgi:hypothetical protein